VAHQAGQRAITLLTQQLVTHVLQQHGTDPEAGRWKLHARKGHGIHLLPLSLALLRFHSRPQHLDVLTSRRYVYMHK